MTQSNATLAPVGVEDREETARDFGLGAVEAMEQHGVPLTPSNYRVWFNFIAGHDPNLVKMMNVLLSNKVTFTQDRNREIYERFYDSGSAFDDLYQVPLITTDAPIHGVRST